MPAVKACTPRQSEELHSLCQCWYSAGRAYDRIDGAGRHSDVELEGADDADAVAVVGWHAVEVEGAGLDVRVTVADAEPLGTVERPPDRERRRDNFENGDFAMRGNVPA